MQNFDGENSYAMKKAVWAVLFHCRSFSDPEYLHLMCPRNEVQRTNANKEHINLSAEIHDF